MANHTKRHEFSQKQKTRKIQQSFGNKRTIKDPAGRTVTRKNAQVDHIVPASRGGKATLKNAQVLHPKTNLEKSNKMRGTIGPKSHQKTFSVSRKNQTMKTKNK